MTKKKAFKNTAGSIQRWRLTAQIIFILLSIWIGIEFTLFVYSLEGGGSLSPRPPGVEAYLPISALMSFVYFLRTGIIHPVHPAGFFLFLAFLVISFILGKSFCSWICPIGTVSEFIGSFGEKLFGKKLKLPRWADYPLRSLKYFLLAFFVWSVITMTAYELMVFLDSGYNKIADIKLFDFFRNISGFSIIVLSALVLLSIPFRNFWCRYLCPYGALFGVLSVFSPVKISRVSESCIDCDKCDDACPSFIKISTTAMVVSDECTSCLQCLDACPVNKTLELRNVVTRKTLNKKRTILVVALLYLFILGIGIFSGKWHGSTSGAEYRTLYHQRDIIGH